MTPEKIQDATRQDPRLNSVPRTSWLVRGVAFCGDVAACVVLGAFWLVSGAWRAIPRHTEGLCWDCQHGVAHDRSAVVW